MAIMCTACEDGKRYSLDYFLKLPSISFMKQIFIKSVAIFYIPILIIEGLFMAKDDNIITKGKKNLKGKFNASSSKVISMPALKAHCKKSNVTINDVLTCATGSAVKEILR